MNLHEFQAKELFESYDLPVSKRGLIKELSDIDSAIDSQTAMKTSMFVMLSSTTQVYHKRKSGKKTFNHNG